MQQSTHAPSHTRPLVRSHRDVATIDAGISLRAPMVAKLLGITCGSNAHVASRLCGELRVNGERNYARGELIGGEPRETLEGLRTCVHRSGKELPAILKGPGEAGR